MRGSSAAKKTNPIIVHKHKASAKIYFGGYIAIAKSSHSNENVVSIREDNNYVRWLLIQGSPVYSKR